MNIQEFFNYRDKCPVCNNVLSKSAKIDAYTEGPSNRFFVPGSSHYDYNGRKFIKNNLVLNYLPDKKVIYEINKFMPKTFSINKRLIFRINKIKLSEKIAPDFLHSLSTEFYRTCSGDHLYYYASTYFFEGASNENIELGYENVTIHDITIYNRFVNGAPNATHVMRKGTQSILPFISVDKWDTASASSIERQLDKYLLLK